jgi:hypothetical protein
MLKESKLRENEIVSVSRTESPTNIYGAALARANKKAPGSSPAAD